MNVLFYDEGAVFGGHEMATMTVLEQLARTTDWQMTFAFAEVNDRLHDRLEEIRAIAGERFKLAPLRVAGKSFQGVRSAFSPRAVSYVRDFARQQKPDVIVTIQGNIELGSMGLLAFEPLGIPILSYVPYAHTFREVGVKGWQVRDVLNRRYYRIPDRFVTQNESVGEALKARGVIVPVDFAMTGRSAEDYVVRNRSAARHRYGIADDRYVIGMVGRTMIKQKGHDVLIEAVAKHRERVGRPLLFFVGDGPDLDQVKKMAADAGLGEDALFVTWEKEMAYAYSAFDALALPSRFEGLPLVMIEAMHYSIPVIASDRDGMHDILPNEWLFPTEDRDALADRIAYIRSTDQSAQTAWFKKLAAGQWTPENFGKQFADAITRTAAMKQKQGSASQ